MRDANYKLPSERNATEAAHMFLRRNRGSQRGSAVRATVPAENPAPRYLMPAECGGLSMHSVRKLRWPFGRVGGVICETLRVARFCAAFTPMF